MKKAITVAALTLAALFAVGFEAQEPERVEISREVDRGETVWDIAWDVKDEYQDPRDVRQIVYEIKKANGGDLIHEGQRLRITIQPEAQA